MKNIFKKFVFVLLFSLLTFSAQALDFKGVKVNETSQVGSNVLVLNGVGVRTKAMFKVYVAALYLTHKLANADSVLSDTGNKRMVLQFLRELSAEKLLRAIEEGFKSNNSAAEMASIEPQMKAFLALMTSVKTVKEGDEILLDYAGLNTTVSLNGNTLGSMEGAMFNKALLRVWLGEMPVDASLKKALLGQ